MKIFNRYLSSINNVQVLNLPAADLDRILSKFFKDVRKINGEEYEPDRLPGFQRNIHKSYLNVLIDKELETSRKVLGA